MPEEAAPGTPPAVSVEAEGKRHRLESALSVTAISLGLIALIVGGFIPPAHFIGALAGVIGLPVALYSQLVSATTNERWLNVIGMVASFVGAAFALRNGGFGL